MESKNNQIEVVYTKAKLSKRIFSYFVDIGLFLLSSFILFSIINMGITRSHFFVSKQEELVQLRNESGLFIDGEVITTYVENEGKFPSYNERKVALRTAIDFFYNNSTYFSDVYTIQNQYNSRKVSATNSDGVHLFIIYEETLIENSVSDQDLALFYKSEIDNYSLAYLMNNPSYFNLTRFSFLVSVIEFLIISIFCFIIFFLVFPLTLFKRGRQTLGMKLANVGLISVTASNVPTGKFIGRFFFELFIMYFLNFVSFLIPSFLSLGMLFITPTNSSLVNYVFNDYAVDVTNQKIYFDALEREEATIKLQEISIENRDLKLK